MKGSGRLVWLILLRAHCHMLYPEFMRGLSTIIYQGKGYFPQLPGKSHIFKVDLTPAIGSGSSFQASSFGQRRNTTSKDLRTDAVFVDVTGRMEEPREHRRSTNSFM